MNPRSPLQVYLSPRMAILTGLGFAAGLPALLIKDTLAAWLASSNVDVKTIGIFALVTLPYSLKFLWSPFMDAIVPPILGRRRGWLIITQLALMAGIIAMAMIGPKQPMALAVAALIVAFLSASQDIVSDAYRTDVLRTHEMGAGAAVFTMGYRLAMIASGAGVLMLVGYMGWVSAYVLMAIGMGLGVIFTLAAREPERQAGSPTTIVQAVIKPMQAFIAHRPWWMTAALFVFVLIFRLPDALAAQMTMPFLLEELSFTVKQVGAIRQFAGIGLSILGVLAGGLILAKMNLKVGLLLFGLLQAVSNAGFLMMAWYGGGLPTLTIVIVVESFCGGLVVAGFVGFLMSQCDPRYSAAQYAVLSSVMVLAGTLASALTGYMVASEGYARFFLMTIVAGIPGLLMIPFLPPPVKREAEAETVSTAS